MNLTELLEEIKRMCRTCKECDPCCTGNILKKYIHFSITFDCIIDSLSKGETVELRNFGVFKVRMRKGRMGRNPRTGDAVPIPVKKVVTFKPGLVMMQSVK